MSKRFLDEDGVKVLLSSLSNMLNDSENGNGGTINKEQIDAIISSWMTENTSYITESEIDTMFEDIE